MNSGNMTKFKNQQQPWKNGINFQKRTKVEGSARSYEFSCIGIQDLFSRLYNMSYLKIEHIKQKKLIE